MLRDDSYPKLLDSRLRGNDGSKSGAGFARENKFIHPLSGFQMTPKPKGKT